MDHLSGDHVAKADRADRGREPLRRLTSPSEGTRQWGPGPAQTASALDIERQVDYY